MKRSIILYTNNSEKYISKQLDSILEQIDDTKEQLIIVDDLSEDQTIPIIVAKINYFFTDEEHYKLFINTSKKGKKDSVEMAKKIATGDFKFIINGKKKVRL